MRSNRSIPSATVIPVLVYPDVRAAVAWLTDALGFAERVRIGDAHRSQMAVGDGGGVIIADAHGEQHAPQPGLVTHLVKIRVADVDAVFERARRHGARIIAAPADRPYGERECTVEDPAGHRWQLTQTVRDVAPEEWGGQTVGR
ncbi:MAG TPA: VOC family protein [Acidimicrobiia bacterium]|nr:VOC family protein [Acidimicrobiia bacterium]